MRIYDTPPQYKTPSGGSVHLDTLETTGYSPPPNPREPLVRRTLQKGTTLENTFKLIDLNSPLKKAYWKTYHCGSIILQEGEKFHFQPG